MRLSSRLLPVMLALSLVLSMFGSLGPQPVAVAATPRADMLGVSGNAFPWEPHWGEFQHLLTNSGAGWVRTELRWNQVQPSRSEWDWGGTDWLVNSYADLDFQQLGLLGYSVAWANGGSGNGPVFGPPGDLDAWENYVRQTVRRYKHQIHAWEIWNEPDVAMFWGGRDGGDPAVYLEMQKRAYRAIKAEDPSAIVMNGGLTGTERGARFMQTFLDLGGGAYIDAVAFHGYMSNDGVQNDYFRHNVWPLVRQARERAGKPLWITEFGWSVRSGDSGAAGSEQVQATYLARHLPLLFDLGGVERAFVFQFKDPNDNPNYFGITRSNATIRPAYTAIATMGNRLSGLSYQERTDLGVAGVEAFRFGSDSRTVDVVWSTSGDKSVFVPTGQSSVRVWRIDGQYEDRNTSGGGVQITAGGNPVMIERNGREVSLTIGGPCDYHPETRHSICGLFREFWYRSGGLPVFGYPLGAHYTDPASGGRTAQYLERQRFEHHPDLNGTPYEVLLGHLGIDDARARGLLNSAPFQPLPAGTSSDASCTFFSETGHRLCFGFRTYWESHGLEFGDPGVTYRESLALFGYPISEEFVDPDTGLVTQYFERARFEYHPNNPEPYKTLLGRLGAESIGW